MRRVDLRHLKGEFLHDMQATLAHARAGEVLVFLFEIGEFDAVERAINLVLVQGDELMTSLKFNQVDWTIVVKKGRR